MKQKWLIQQSNYLIQIYIKYGGNPFKRLKYMLEIKFGEKEYFDPKHMKNRIRYQFYKAIKVWKQLFKPQDIQEKLFLQRTKITYMNIVDLVSYPLSQKEMAEAHNFLLSISEEELRKNVEITQGKLRKIFNLIKINYERVQEIANMNKQNQIRRLSMLNKYTVPENKAQNSSVIKNEQNKQEQFFQEQHSQMKQSIIQESKSVIVQKKKDFLEEENFEIDESKTKKEQMKEQVKEQEIKILEQGQIQQEKQTLLPSQESQLDLKNEKQKIEQVLKVEHKVSCQGGFQAVFLCKDTNCNVNALLCYSQPNNCQKCLKNHKACRTFTKINIMIDDILKKKTEKNHQIDNMMVNKAFNILQGYIQKINILKEKCIQIQKTYELTENQSIVLELLQKEKEQPENMLFPNGSGINKIDQNRQEIDLKRKEMIKEFKREWKAELSRDNQLFKMF